MSNKKRGCNKTLFFAGFFGAIMVVFIACAAGMRLYYNMVNQKDYGRTGFYEYQYHYAFITDRTNDLFWDSIYEGAREEGEKNDIYVERFGHHMTVEFSLDELLEMAIASNVDGIIMRGKDTYGISQSIHRAADKGIPVVTVLDDCIISTRCSNIGINNFKLGKEYANQIINYSEDETKNIVVLLDSERADSNQNIIYQGITATLRGMGSKSNIRMEVIDTTDMFRSEEIIRNLVRETKISPDIIVCLSLMDTLCAYQSVVDFNKVGEITIIGYYASETVLEAIRKEIISATLVVNTKQMGGSAVNALYDYKRYGRISDYISVDTEMVNTSNIAVYMEENESRGLYVHGGKE